MIRCGCGPVGCAAEAGLLFRTRPHFRGTGKASSARPSGSPRAASIFPGSAGVNSRPLGEHCGRQRLIAWSTVMTPSGVSILSLLCAVVDPLHRAPERKRKAFHAGGNRGSVTVGDTPVPRQYRRSCRNRDARNAIELGAADVMVPTALIRLFQRPPGLSSVAAATSGSFWKLTAHARIEFFLRFKEFALDHPPEIQSAAGAASRVAVFCRSWRCCSSATATQGLRSAECSQPQPRSS